MEEYVSIGIIVFFALLSLIFLISAFISYNYKSLSYIFGDYKENFTIALTMLIPFLLFVVNKFLYSMIY